jgi:hypothetical protein
LIEQDNRLAHQLIKTAKGLARWCFLPLPEQPRLNRTRAGAGDRRDKAAAAACRVHFSVLTRPPSGDRDAENSSALEVGGGASAFINAGACAPCVKRRRTATRSPVCGSDRRAGGPAARVRLSPPGHWTGWKRGKACAVGWLARPLRPLVGFEWDGQASGR